LPAYTELGTLLLRQERIEEAAQVYQLAIDSNPDENALIEELEVILARQCNFTVESGRLQEECLRNLPKASNSAGRILVYTDCPGVDGAEQCNHQLMCEMKAVGYEVICAQSKAQHPLIEDRHRLGIEHEWLAYDNIYDMSKPARALTDLFEPQHVLAATRPNLIIFGDGCPFSNLAAKQVATQLGIPYIIVIHCVNSAWAQQFSYYLHKLPDVYQQARAVVAVSHQNLELLHDLFGLQEHLGLVIYNGRASEYFAEPDLILRRTMRQSLGFPTDAVVCLTVARMELSKGYHYQLEAIKQLKQDNGWSKLFFMWVGIGSLGARLRAATIGLGVTEHVKFLGRRFDVLNLLDAADIFVLPSQFEGMPLSVTEAMAKGLPVVASAVSGISEQLGNTGVLLPDPEKSPQLVVSELAGAIRTLAMHPELRFSVGQACKERAKRLFTQDQMVRQYLEIIAEILPSPVPDH
jgi:glycosyltransferase involved in cell wall biosynthesis